MNFAWTNLTDVWSRLVFGDRHKDITPKIRVLRLLEEVIELAQAEGVTRDEVGIITEQVMAKPPGDRFQELGGVAVCLSGYCATSGLMLDDAFHTEFQRICDPAVMNKVRTRNLAGDKIGFDKK